MRITDWCRLIEQGMNVTRHTGDQRHLHEDQGLVGHAGMEKGKAATIRLEPVLQVGPPADLVHGLIGHQLLKQRRRRFPGDSLELEKADVEPVGEQSLQILLEARESGIVLPEINQLGAAVDEELYPIGERVELA